MSDLKFFTDGEAYERMIGRWSRSVGERFLDWIAAPAGLRWLDVGCGNGAFTETLIAHCAPADVDGIDLSEAQITYATTRLAGKRARFQLGGAQDLPFEDATFDAAVMALVLSFLPDPEKAVAEMVRVVRPGGLIATYMWVPYFGSPGAPFVRAAKELGIPATFSMPGLDVAQLAGMQRLWESAGLKNVEARQIDIDVSFRNFDDFWQSNTALPNPSVQYLRTLSTAEVDRVRDWLGQHLSEERDGRITYTASANAVKGRVPG